MSTLGDWIRDSADVTSTREVIEAKAREADRLVDLLEREKGLTAAVYRSNLDLIKRLKEANDKLEGVRSVADEWDSSMAAPLYDKGPDAAREIYDILEG